MISQKANDAIMEFFIKHGLHHKQQTEVIMDIHRIERYLNSITEDENSEQNSETSGLEEIGFCMTCAFFHWKPDWGNLGKCGRVEETPPVCQGLSCEEYEMHSEYENFFDEKGYPLPSPPKESE